MRNGPSPVSKTGAVFIRGLGLGAGPSESPLYPLFFEIHARHGRLNSSRLPMRPAEATLTSQVRYVPHWESKPALAKPVTPPNTLTTRFAN